MLWAIFLWGLITNLKGLFVGDICDFYNNHTVDPDFDELFYQQEYPETKDFYQPFCKENGISDRQRLFYHFKLYYELLKKSPKPNGPNISPRRLLKPNRLAIITSFYNPCNYTNLKYNYSVFAKHIRQFGDLFPIELSFDGSFFIEDPNVIQVTGSSHNCLWQKESLLNIRLEKLPSEYTDVAWIDCDIIFTDPLWPKRLFDLLSRYRIVQLFSHGYRLDSTGHKLSRFAGMVSHYPYGTSGFAWAGRREILEQITFLNTQLAGGADSIMGATFMNKLEILDQYDFFVNDEITKDWIKNTIEIVNGSVGYLNNEITHLYHGSIENRRYQERHKRIKDAQVTDFHFDKIWSVRNVNIQKTIQSYFAERLEDDNLLQINTYFDHVYVLNLDSDKLRLKEVSERLKKLGINFSRFPAVDGRELEFSSSEFTLEIDQQVNKFELACRLSHLKIIEDAKRNGFTKILIFEDDVFFCTQFNIHLQSLRNHLDWKLLYFGASQYNWENITYINNFYIPHKTTGAFAYAIHSSIFDEILAMKDDQMAIDISLTKIQEKHKDNCFVFYPNLCSANVQSSNIREPRDQTQFNEKFRWNILNYE